MDGGAAQGDSSPKRLRRSGGRLRGGSLDYYIQTANDRPGPRTLDDLLDWPAFLDNLAFEQDGGDGPVRRARLQALLQPGLVSHTDCSGKMTPETVLCIMGMKHQLPPGWLANFRCCDVDSLCQKVCQNSGHLTPMHMFSSLAGRLPTKWQRELAKLRPRENSGVGQTEVALDKMRHLMQQHSKDMFGDQMAGNCLMHPGRLCRVRWRDPDVPETQRPLTSSMAGTPCLPWTPHGSRKGRSHPDIEVFDLWLQEGIEGNYDLLWLENSELFEKELFERRLPKRYITRCLTFGPQHIGQPNRRDRTFMVAINLDTLCWVGPNSDELVSSLFQKMFGCSVQLEGDVFAKADTLANVQGLRADLAKQRGCFCSAEQLGRLSARALLCGGDQSRYDGYAAMHSRVGFGGSMIADVSQDPEARPRVGAWIPSITKQTCVVSLTADHVYTPNEVDAIMGWPTLEGTRAHRLYSSAIGFDFGIITRGQRMALAGNSMHCAALYSWFLFVFSHLVRRATVEALSFQLFPSANAQADRTDREKREQRAQAVQAPGLARSCLGAVAPPSASTAED